MRFCAHLPKRGPNFVFMTCSGEEAIHIEEEISHGSESDHFAMCSKKGVGVEIGWHIVILCLGVMEEV